MSGSQTSASPDTFTRHEPASKEGYKAGSDDLFDDF